MNSKKFLNGISESEIRGMAADILARLEEAAVEEGSSAAYYAPREERLWDTDYYDFSYERNDGRKGASGYVFAPRGNWPRGGRTAAGDEFFDEPQSRANRRDFFGQRGARRVLDASRDGEGGRAGEPDRTDAGTLTTNQELGQTRLPEKLSELFCRDARRFDGAFERY